MDRQRLMPAGHWNWRGGQWSSISQGWRVGNLVFVGGQVALDAEGQVMAPGDIGAQTRSSTAPSSRSCARPAPSLRDVVKITSFLVTDAEGEAYDEFWRTMAGARREFFPAEGPCGTGVVVPALLYPGLVIEVEAIAVIPDERAA